MSHPHEDTDKKTYNIIRYYAQPNKKARTIRKNISYKQAMEHVNDPTTSKKGVWFDGFTVNE